MWSNVSNFVWTIVFLTCNHGKATLPRFPPQIRMVFTAMTLSFALMNNTHRPTQCNEVTDSFRVFQLHSLQGNLLPTMV